MTSENSVQSVDVYIVSATLPRFDFLKQWECSDVYNRGTRVGPEGRISCHMTDVFQCRFKYSKDEAVSSKEVLDLLAVLQEKKITWCQVNLIWA
jgi:hypothetical protein